MDISKHTIELSNPKPLMVLGAFSIDGSILITVHGALSVSVWDTHTGARKLELEFPATDESRPEHYHFYVEAACLSKDGSLALLGFNDGTAALFSVITGKRLLTVELPESIPYEQRYGNVRAVNFSPDESLILVGFHNRNVAIWDRAGNQLKHFYHFPQPLIDYDFSGSPGPLIANARHISITPDNRYLFVVYIDSTAVIYDVGEDKPVVDAYLHSDHIEDVSVNNDMITAITGSGTVWQLQHEKVHFAIQMLLPDLHAAMLSSNGRSFIGRTRNSIVQGSIAGEFHTLANIEEKSPVAVNGTTNLFTDEDGSVLLCSPSASQYVISTVGKTANIDVGQKAIGCVLSPTRDVLAVFSTSQVHLWNMTQQQFVGRLKIDGRITGGYLSNSGDLIAIKFHKKGKSFVAIFDIENQSQKYIIEASERVISVIFVSDDSAIVTTGPGSTFNYWSLKEQSTIRSPDVQITVPGLSSRKMFALSNQRIAIIGRKRIEIWYRLDEKIHEFPTASMDKYRQWKLTPDRRILTVMSKFQTVRCWDVENNVFLGEFGPDIPRPKEITAEPGIAEIKPRVSIQAWDYKDTEFIYQPGAITRGMRRYQINLDEQLMAIPCEGDLAVVQIKKPRKVVCIVPLRGDVVTTFVTKEFLYALEQSGKLLVFPYNELDEHCNP